MSKYFSKVVWAKIKIYVNYIIMSQYIFNKELWTIGEKIENDTLPLLNKYFNCDFKRNENDIFDILDFKDDNNKIIVEVKGRRNTSTKYKDTLITASKVNEGLKKIDEGYKVYFVFAFTDKVMEVELLDQDFKCKITGTNSILHYLIPVEDLTDMA